MKLVEVRPIEKNRWHGKSGQESFGQAQAIRVLYDHETGGYATGLTDEETEEYSKRLGLDLSKTFSPLKPHPYWDSSAAKIKLPNFPIFLDPTIPLDFIRIKNLKASSLVANSMKDYQDGKYPEATHIIFDEAEEVDMKATKIERKKKAYSLSSSMTKETKENILAIISEKSVKGRSENFINVQLDEVIEERTEEFIKYAEMDKEQLNVRSIITEALYKNILTKEGLAIYYMNDRVANSYEDAIEYFSNPQNQQMKVALLEKLT